MERESILKDMASDIGVVFGAGFCGTNKLLKGLVDCPKSSVSRIKSLFYSCSAYVLQGRTNTCGVIRDRVQCLFKR